MSAAARAGRVAIRLYQRVTAGAQPRCRYWPSCSEYADDAIRLHGARRGTVLAVRRLARCHPWGGSGHDPVRGGNIRLDQTTRGTRGHVE